MKQNRSIQADFNLVSPYEPAGDQTEAIRRIGEGFHRGKKRIGLLGVTGSGKTFTMAHVIRDLGLPTLVMSHNKTLCAQLYREFCDYFPHNAVEYFVSYYDYYQPEAYVPTTDTYIEKDASINDEIDRLRLRATAALLERRDVIIVSSVSCIYGLGSPEDYAELMITLHRGDVIDRDMLMRALVRIQYERNAIGFGRGSFRVRGDRIDIYPAYKKEVIRLEFFGDEVESISLVHPLTGDRIRALDRALIFPARHFVTSAERLRLAVGRIRAELAGHLAALQKQNKLLEAQRIETRTRFDIEMLEQMGYCSGIENYSRHISGRQAGEPPATLIDYFPDEFLLIVDESHVTLPQVRGMYAGDRSRKQTLIDYGFRLPSALDNRPLRFDEFQQKLNRVLYVSATLGDFELEHSEQIVEQIIRPTGLVDPAIEVRPTKGQVDDLIGEIRKRISLRERVLVTTLTKKFAENLSAYFLEAGIPCRYLHSEIETIERVELIRDLRKGEFDCLIGINLLREGLDIPEVSLVAVLDADKEGFLRSARSLIQIAGRAARNRNGLVVFYADRVTPSMRETIQETDRRRKKQLAYNRQHGIIPKTIDKEIVDIIEREKKEEPTERDDLIDRALDRHGVRISDRKETVIEALQKEMLAAADKFEFEQAAVFRDKILELEGSKVRHKVKQRKIRRKSAIR